MHIYVKINGIVSVNKHNNETDKNTFELLNIKH